VELLVQECLHPFVISNAWSSAGKRRNKY